MFHKYDGGLKQLKVKLAPDIIIEEKEEEEEEEEDKFYQFVEQYNQWDTTP